MMDISNKQSDVSSSIVDSSLAANPSIGSIILSSQTVDTVSLNSNDVLTHYDIESSSLSTNPSVDLVLAGRSTRPLCLSSSPAATIPKNKPKMTKRSNNANSVSNYIDKINEKEESILNEKLAKLVFRCNLPLRLVESKHFKSFVQQLRPAYASKLPGRKALSMTLLDNAYLKCISSAKARISDESVLLIDGWKNSSSNSKLVVTMLHHAGNDQAFLQAWDLTGESETGEKLADILLESLQIANELYDAKVFAVISDNASTMLKMGRLTNHVLWHSTCNSHTANLLAKDVLDLALTDKVIMVLKEFKHPDLEKGIVMHGGNKIKLASETRRCSYRDAYRSLLKNLEPMKIVTAESKFKKVKTDVVSLIFNEEFIDLVTESIAIFDPLCHLINMCQSASFSVADAANLLLSML